VPGGPLNGRARRGEGRDAKIDWKTLSKRIGHKDVAFTMKQYVQIDLEAVCEGATTRDHAASGRPEPRGAPRAHGFTTG
jgi:hypothetical protein